MAQSIRLFRRYGDILINLTLIERIELRETPGLFRSNKPAIDFWGHRMVSFANQGPDTRPTTVSFDSVEEARAEFATLSRILSVATDETQSLK